MKHLSVKDIIQVQQQQQKRRNEAFDYILETCYNKIRKSLSTIRNSKFILFDVPEFLIGYPLYDLNECITYIVTHLQTGGFALKYIFPKILIVSWAVTQPEQQTLCYGNNNAANIDVQDVPLIETKGKKQIIPRERKKAPNTGKRSTTMGGKSVVIKQNGKFIYDL